VSAEMVHEALQAQTAAISALAEELKASRKQAAPAGPPRSKPPGDEAPGKPSHWYYGR